MDLFCQAFDLLEMPKLFTLNEFTENMLLSRSNLDYKLVKSEAQSQSSVKTQEPWHYYVRDHYPK